MHEINKGGAARFVSLMRMWGHGPGARMLELTDDEHLHRRPAISPDGRLLAWQTDMNGKDDEIYLANVDGSNARSACDAGIGRIEGEEGVSSLLVPQDAAKPARFHRSLRATAPDRSSFA